MLKKTAPVFLLLLLVLSSAPYAQDLSGLLPPLRPYKTGYLKVSDVHELYYQLGGNPEEKPVMVIHGGPGAGCSPLYFRFFNPEKFHIILHDQRGAGQSRPYGEVKDNTTQHLVADIEKVRKHLGLDKVILFGGSWGTTLALAYAEAYPQNVRGMILRGVFLATEAEIDHFYHGATAKYFPKNYEELCRHVSEPEKKDFPAQFLARLQGKDPVIRDACARAWARYEYKICFLHIPDEEVDRLVQRSVPYAFSLIENYYMAHKCFLKEGQLLENADKLAAIPVTIVNGRYDVVCPPISAYRLHKRLPKSKLLIVEEAGHTAIDPEMLKTLMRVVKEWE